MDLRFSTETTTIESMELKLVAQFSRFIGAVNYSLHKHLMNKSNAIISSLVFWLAVVGEYSLENITSQIYIRCKR